MQIRLRIPIAAAPPGPTETKHVSVAAGVVQNGSIPPAAAAAELAPIPQAAEREDYPAR